MLRIKDFSVPFDDETPLAQLAAQPVAVHGMGQLGADGQADAVLPGAVFAAVEHEIAVGRALALAVEAAEDMIEL